MRHISFEGAAVDPEWLAAAGALLVKLDAAAGAAERAEIVDGNSALWGSLKPWLLEISHQKCWFSEAKDCFSHWDVEHYRPKKSAKDLDGTVHDGYWWLSFDWSNLRICGNVGNRMKGTFFPLRQGTTRQGRTGDVRREEPLLLDPTNEDDPTLVFFTFDGAVVPSPHVDDAWELERVSESVTRYKLDFPPLEDKRKAVWADCWQALERYLAELGRYHEDPGNETARAGVKDAARRVRQMIRADAELSSVARACILSSGSPRAMDLLRSA